MENEKQKRTSKEISVNADSSFTASYGSTNRNNPEVLYITGKTYISPKFTSDSYSESIDTMRDRYVSDVRRILSRYKGFDNRLITNMDVSVKGLRNGKNSFMDFNVYVRQKKDGMLSFNTIGKTMDSITKEICDAIRCNIEDCDFSCQKTKTGK